MGCEEIVRSLFVKMLDKNNFDYEKTIGVFVDVLNEVVMRKNYLEEKAGFKIERVVILGKS